MSQLIKCSVHCNQVLFFFWNNFCTFQSIVILGFARPHMQKDESSLPAGLKQKEVWSPPAPWRLVEVIWECNSLSYSLLQQFRHAACCTAQLWLMCRKWNFSWHLQNRQRSLAIGRDSSLRSHLPTAGRYAHNPKVVPLPGNFMRTVGSLHTWCYQLWHKG